MRNYVMSSDMEGYYQYLPYFFIKDKQEIKHMRWAKPYENGNKLNVFTCGVAIMQAPFFFIAHGISKYFRLQSDGYAFVYFIFVFLATLFYVTIGLAFLYKALLHFFEERYALLTAALVFFCTNLFYYTIIMPGMSHAYSFSLVTIFVYLVPVFYDNVSAKNALKLAFPFALAVLIRPTTLVIGLYFLLYRIHSWHSLRERMKLLFQKWYLVFIMAFASLLVFLPQMFYWHFVTGKYFIYSYQNEGFTNILSPHISTVLIGARNGLFLYTPIMFLAVCSMFYLVYKKKLSALGILLVMIIIVYLDGSWWRPTFSGAAGYRALIEFYPLLAIPLAFLIQTVLKGQHKGLKIGLKIGLVFFVVYNVLFAYKYSHYLWWNTDWQWSHFLRLVQF
ncbi:hypothetical protein [uncultured Sunxiuqinia sp.]|uniref:hypothetical protein n=1 Tax=uncultured Sunxiuqinia sp. TaxID=1573825 RepID=UPI002AA7EFCA|nr:hypothetical protein [uncultured Sunxiuqinia sp.]